MASKKRPNNKTSNYLISMGEGDLTRDGANYLGKLRSNFVGTEFQVCHSLSLLSVTFVIVLFFHYYDTHYCCYLYSTEQIFISELIFTQFVNTQLYTLILFLVYF